VAALAQASWPHPRTGTDLPGPAAQFDHYLASGRREANLRHLRRGIPQTTTTHDTPPVDPTACGSLLALAAEILDSADTRTAHERLAPLAAHAPALRTWARTLLADTGPCSPALRDAAALRPSRTGTPGRHPPPPPTSPQVRQRRFGHQHIPAYLTAEWHEQYFSGMDGVNPQTLRRTAAVKLTQMCEGGSAAAAARLLGIPPHIATTAISTSRRRLGTQGWEHFGEALDALAGYLDQATGLTDYGRRRHATRTWAITPTTWAELTGDLARHSHCHTTADASDLPRLFATVVVWTRLTCGEHHFAPALGTGTQSPEQTAGRHRYVHQAWKTAHMGIETSSHYYAPLVERLDVLAADLATRIDTGQDLPE
jgi:hypothetical protein